MKPCTSLHTSTPFRPRSSIPCTTQTQMFYLELQLVQERL
ncbi:hypothetical protein AB205_0181590 [Aquarana catesbeiana]|uniref:Uncharacterized protein n=1 Tax=Aquarana catesbeiana TaxID=8400 RepID=A0A2G9Q1H4_AQUCT|nr:hypothetical protein AB205_0181590 [Aquarana catesbeiana]